MDTKYKRNPEPDSDDLRQIVAYAVSIQTNDAFLVYPSSITKAFDIFVGEKVRVQGLVFDIGMDPDESGQKFLNHLKKKIFRYKCIRNFIR